MEKKYLGTTVNERLYLSGLIDEFYKAIDERNYFKAKAILGEVELTEESISPILDSFGLVAPVNVMEMLLPDITIQPFDPRYQPGVDLMLGTIVPEYPEPFFHLPLRKIEELYTLPGRHYWVVLNDDTVIGSVGIVVVNDYAVLKSLFVFKIWRGEEKGVANNLMKVATDKAKEEGCTTMYLGTMEQFKPAQRFYEKLGYQRIDAKDLPADFPNNEIDKVFFRKSI